MFLVTNTTLGDEYTPSVFANIDSATAWLKECTAGNIRAAYSNTCEDMEDDEALEWAEENVDGFVYDLCYSMIWYDDENYNRMEIYDLSKLEINS